MDIPPILGPAAVLVLWSLVVLLWMTSTRFPAFAKAGINLANTARGARYADVEKNMPEKVNWVSHNYTHLMEQPTIFYPTIIILAMMGAGAIDVLLAWIYVGLRIVHSLWQALVNVVAIRFLLFILSTLALAALAVRAVSVTLLADPGVL